MTGRPRYGAPAADIIVLAVLVLLLAGAALLWPTSSSGSGTPPAAVLPLPGPEPPSSSEEFRIVFEEVTRPVTVYEVLRLDSGEGWDFGDRDGYECAAVELFGPNGGKLLQVDFEQSRDYITAAGGAIFRINDRLGVETGEGPGEGIPPLPCGDETHGPPNNSRWVPSGEDHFPHMTIGADPETHGLRFYTTSTNPDVIELVEAAAAALNAEVTNEECDRGYWTPGDEPGELVLWWDVDFPENGHHDGGQPLDCGGGGGEPIAVARANFVDLAPHMGVCIFDHDLVGGRTCIGTVPAPPSPSPTVPPTTDPPTPSETTSPTVDPPAVVCYSGVLTAEDGSGATLEARVCEPAA